MMTWEKAERVRGTRAMRRKRFSEILCVQKAREYFMTLDRGDVLP